MNLTLKALGLAATVAASLALAGCMTVLEVAAPLAQKPTFTVTSEPLEGQVVDTDTLAPIEGANVIAIWELTSGTLHGRKTEGLLHVDEAVTGADGRFQIAGFTKLNPNPLWAVRDSAPHVLVFKSDYRIGRGDLSQYNKRHVIIGGRGTTQADLVSGRLRLEYRAVRKVPGEFAYMGVPSLLTEFCAWPYAPKAFAAFDAEHARLRALDPTIYVSLPSTDRARPFKHLCHTEIK